MGRLTVLGRSGGYPAPGCACSGYLLETDGAKLALDLGSGALSRLNSLLSIEQLDGVLLSHLHYDHFSDLLVLQYQLEAAIRAGRRKGPLCVYAPNTPVQARALLNNPEAFRVCAIQDGLLVSIGDLSVTFHEVRHGDTEAYGMDLRLPGGKRFFYTGDTGYFHGLENLIGGAETLLCDTAFLAERDDGTPLPHLTTVQAARLARESGVKTLLCTHLPEKGNIVPLMEKEIDFPDATVVKELRQYIL